MKKLQNKVFLVIFILLTSFTFIILTTTTTKLYFEKRKIVSNTITRIPNGDRKMPPTAAPDMESRRIYLDSTVYTVILDENGKLREIINNTRNEDFDKEKIINIANNIIENHDSDIYIGNLYINKYAYFFAPDNTLIIMDNTEINNTLVRELVLNILIFVLCEVIIFVITHFITKWIITPVKKSFEKQKVFVADASHELKTPLSVMIASADAYFNDKDDKWVHNMKNESERMVKLVTELLDLAKTEEEQDIVMEDANLSNVIESSVLTFESLFYENKIKLKYNIEKDIKLLCNQDLIVELMSILIDNAIKHCSSKGDVSVNLNKTGKVITLEVVNTGLPISKDEEEKIFERFYKIDASRNRNSNNYGLGLSIAKNIVEKHNGGISAHSDNGYTTFKIIWNQK